MRIGPLESADATRKAPIDLLADLEAVDELALVEPEECATLVRVVSHWPEWL